MSETLLDRWRASHAQRKAPPGEPTCGDRSSYLRPNVPCDLPLGHEPPHESEFGFWGLEPIYGSAEPVRAGGE